MHLMYHDLKSSTRDLGSDYDILVSEFERHVRLAARCEEPPLFTFDDGYKSGLDAARILQESGLKGIFFVISGRIGMPGYLDEEDIRKIARSGHEIGSHSHSHPMFDRISDDRIADELTTSRRILEALLGTAVTKFAFPGGKYRSSSPGLACRLGYKQTFTSFESPRPKDMREIPRMHVRQSTAGRFERICARDRSYLLQRYLRSCSVRFKDALGF
jgi:peptidoglycan/xylan/chitin deacetylase (PgdA/CDA1 family)